MTTNATDPFDSKRLSKAFAFAAQLHKGQVRKGTDIPYLSHLMAVAALVMENGGTEDQVIAALLHDGPEDRGGKKTLRKIRRRFGKKVREIVKDCTDTFETPKPAWKPRKVSYLEHLEGAPESTLLVSLSDKVHNLGCIVQDLRVHGDDLWSRFKTGRDGTVWYYQELARVFGERVEEGNLPQLEPLVAALRRSLEELDELLGETAVAVSE